MLLLTVLWPGLAAAAALGLLIGGLAGWPARPGVPLALCVLTALVAALAWAGPVHGVPGLWLESAGLILPPYCAGCALGALARFFWDLRRPAASEGGAGPNSRAGKGQGEGRGPTAKT